jgi:hypothetical protein
VAGSCEYANKTSGSVKGGKFLDRLMKDELPKNDSSPLNKFVSYLFNYTTDNFVRQQPTRLLFSRSKWDTLSHPILSHFDPLQIFCPCCHKIRLNIISI